MNKKRIVVILICLLLIVFVIVALKVLRKENVDEVKNVFNLDKFELQNRTKFYIEDKLLIGENEKQLKNGYYDLKIETNSEELVVTLNKLWYESYGKDYIQDEYLAKICRALVSCIEIKKDEKEELEYQLYKYVKDNYLKVKQGESGTVLELYNILIYSESKESECILHIKKE